MSDRVFVDTNILVYAHDRGAGPKHDRAKEVVSHLWEERSGLLSTQVLQEFYINLRRKAKNPVSLEEAKRLLQDYLRWEVVINDGESILVAVDFERRFGLSFWDALVVQAANSAGAETLYSEDFNHGQTYGRVKVVNPFL